MAMQNDDDQEVAGRVMEPMQEVNPVPPREPDEDNMEEEQGNELNEDDQDSSANEDRPLEQNPEPQVQARARRPIRGQQERQRIPIQIITSPWQGELDLSNKAGKMLWNEGTCPLLNKFTGFGKDIV